MEGQMSNVESRMSKVECLSRRERSACPVATEERIGDRTGSNVESRSVVSFFSDFRLWTL